MYNKQELIDRVMSDWSFRVSNGIVDINNYEHRKILKDILKEQGIDNTAISLIIQNLVYGKQLLQEYPSPPMDSPTATGWFGRDKSHVTSSEPHKYFDPYKPQNTKPIQDPDKEDEEEANQDEFTDNPKYESYMFDKEQMKIIKTEKMVNFSDIIIENKFKCFMTGEVYCETKDGSLVKETDIPKKDGISGWIIAT